MATHIHIHRSTAKRTIDADSTLSPDEISRLQREKARMTALFNEFKNIPWGENGTNVKETAKMDCGCGGHKDNIPPDQPGSGNGRFPTGAKDGTADDGAPVNAAWLKLDKMLPIDLEQKASAKGITAQGKTDIIMALLRAEFTKTQIEAWTLFY